MRHENRMRHVDSYIISICVACHTRIIGQCIFVQTMTRDAVDTHTHICIVQCALSFVWLYVCSYLTHPWYSKAIRYAWKHGELRSSHLNFQFSVDIVHWIQNIQTHDTITQLTRVKIAWINSALNQCFDIIDVYTWWLMNDQWWMDSYSNICVCNLQYAFHI